MVNIRRLLLSALLLMFSHAVFAAPKKYVLKFKENFVQKFNEQFLNEKDDIKVDAIAVGIVVSGDTSEVGKVVKDKDATIYLFKDIEQPVNEKMFLKLNNESFCLTKEDSTAQDLGANLTFISGLKKPGTYEVSLAKKLRGHSFLLLRRVEDEDGKKIEGLETMKLPNELDEKKDANVHHSDDEGQEEENNQNNEIDSQVLVANLTNNLTHDHDDPLAPENEEDLEVLNRRPNDPYRPELNILAAAAREEEQAVVGEFTTPPRNFIQVIPGAPTQNRIREDQGNRGNNDVARVLFT